MSFFRKYPFSYLLLTPLLFILITPITVIPSAIISSVFFGFLCEGKGEMCMLGPGLLTLIGINLITSYILGIIIYKVINKPTRRQIIKTAIFLFLYFVLVFGSLFLYDHYKEVTKRNEIASVYKFEQSIEFNDLTLFERDAFDGSVDWSSYDTARGMRFFYPEDFTLEDHQAPSAFYLRTKNTLYTADPITTENSNRFIGIDKIRFISKPEPITDEEILNDLLVHAKPTDESHPKVFKKTVDVVSRKDGTKIYYLEQGYYADTPNYNIMYVAINVSGMGYYLLETYTTFYDGNEITKRVLENSVYY